VGRECSTGISASPRHFRTFRTWLTAWLTRGVNQGNGMFRYHGWGPGRSCRNLLASWFTILLTAQLTNSQKFERRLGRRTHVSKSLRDLVNCPDSPAPLGMSRNSRTQQRLRRSLRPDVRVARCASLRPRLLPSGNVSGVLRQVSRLDEQPLRSHCATGAGPRGCGYV